MLSSVVRSPFTVQGRKAGFRSYVMLVPGWKAAFLYRDGIYAVAGAPMAGNELELAAQVTNDSANADHSLFGTWRDVLSDRERVAVAAKLSVPLRATLSAFLSGAPAQPELSFCVLAADFVLDDDGTPWLLEFNARWDPLIYSDRDLVQCRAMRALLTVLLAGSGADGGGDAVVAANDCIAIDLDGKADGELLP